MRRGFSLLWVVLTGVIAAVVGVASYQAGVSTQLPAGAALPRRLHSRNALVAFAPYTVAPSRNADGVRVSRRRFRRLMAAE